MMFFLDRFSPKVLAFIGLVLTNLFWAGNAITARFIVNDIPPLTLVFGRWLLAFLFLLPFAWPHLKNKSSIIYQHWQILLTLGIMAIGTYNTVLYLAAHSTTAINITLVSSSLPLMALLASWLLLKLRPSNWQLLGIAISLTGVLIVISQGRPAQLIALEFNQGDIMIFGLACLWSVYSVLLRKYPVDLHPIAFLTVLMGIGLPLLAILFLIELIMLPSISLTLKAVPFFLYTAIFPSILSYVFWNIGVKIVGPSISAMSCYLMPLFAALLAIPILNESLYAYHFVGGILILIGLYLGSFFVRKKS